MFGGPWPPLVDVAEFSYTRCCSLLTLWFTSGLRFEMLSFYALIIMPFQVVNRLHKDHVHDTLLNYGMQYDNIWIYDKISHEISISSAALILFSKFTLMFSIRCVLRMIHKVIKKEQSEHKRQTENQIILRYEIIIFKQYLPSHYYC